MTTNQLLAICIFFLGIEERALLERRPHIATWSRRMHEKYRARLERVKVGTADEDVRRSYLPARGIEAPEEVTTPRRNTSAASSFMELEEQAAQEKEKSTAATVDK